MKIGLASHRRLGPAAVGAVVLACSMIAAGAVAQDARGQASPGGLVISVDATELTRPTGETFTFASLITNDGSSPTPALVAHLGFVAIDRQTYVDPEDWSPQRTVSLPPIPAGESVTRTWTVKPVLAGDVAAYVVVLPEDPALALAGPRAISPAIPMHITRQRAINPGGVLPVVLAVPALLALGFIGLRIGLARRHRQGEGLARH